MPAIDFLPFSFPGLEGVRVAFHKRSPGGGGNISLETGPREEALASRQALKKALGFSRWAELRQVHGDAFVPNAAPTPISEPGTCEADGFATATPGLALCIKTADCQPILLAHEGGGHVAAIHAGWRGNRLNFPGSAVRAFCQAWNLVPEELFAVRGPSLGPQNARFANMDREWPPAFHPWADRETMTMDLWAITRAQLEEAGLRPERIFGIDRCTFGESGDFFSYRADPACGRQAALIWIEETP